MFEKNSISNYYRAVLKACEEDLLTRDLQYFYDNDDEKICENLIKSEKYALLSIEINKEKEEKMRHTKEMRRIPESKRERPYGGDLDFEYELVEITVPLVENPTIHKINDLRPSRSSPSWSPEDFSWKMDGVTIVIEIKGYGFKYEDAKIINEIAQSKRRLTDWIGWVNDDIKNGSATLQRDLIPFINERKKKLNEEQGRIAGLSEKLGIPLE